jgi:8-oxo-dGTP pyrophosphatase MutT (NUDIX family)
VTDASSPDIAVPGPNPVARAAATVIVIDEGTSGPAALLVRRNAALRFYGGYWVFPGGAIDAADGAPIETASLHAGCRELREEAGLELGAQDLVYWARWITPSGLPRRFDTRFFVARLPHDQSARIVDGEVTALTWLPSASWTGLSEAGAFPVPLATQFVLRELAAALQEHRSLAALLAAANARQVVPVLPKMVADDVSVLPWDPHYDLLPGEGLPWSAEQTGARRGWPSRG